MATLKDIAEKVNLSTASVSRVLNGDHNLKISEAKRRLILQTAEEMNYKTVQMRKKTDGKILIVSALTIQAEINDPYYISIRNGAENYCLENKQKFEVIYIDKLETVKLDNYIGLIIIGKLEKKYFKVIENYSKPVVFADTNSQDQEYNCITVDLNHITKLAINELIAGGAQNILYLGTFVEDDDYDIRYTSFRHYMSLYKKEPHFLKTSYNSIEVYNALLAYKEINKVDAIFCANDNIAVGALKFLAEMNIEVPNQIQVIGVNDLPICEQITPKISTIKIHSYYMGEVAVRRLSELLINNSEHRMNYVVHSKLIKRATTK